MTETENLKKQVENLKVCLDYISYFCGPLERKNNPTLTKISNFIKVAYEIHGRLQKERRE